LIDTRARQRFAQRKIRGEEIDIFEGRRLIEGGRLEPPPPQKPRVLW
jgi:hypothetical protein